MGIDEDEVTYTGTVKYYRTKRGFGFISIDNEITFQDLTAKGKIYVMKDDIISESESIGLNKDGKVIFKVYKDSMGLGAMDVMNEDGSPIVYVLEAAEGQKEEVVEKEQTPKPEVVEKEQTPEPVKPKKTLIKKKSSKSAKKKKAVKKNTKRKSK